VRLRVRLQEVALGVPASASASVLYTGSHATNDVQRRDEGAKKELAGTRMRGEEVDVY
jgi:hypothetical protein